MTAQKRDENEINQGKIIDQLRCLGIDMISEANSGHPGIVLGAAPILYTLYAHHLRFDPLDPNYFNRDRFVMSAGHGSALLYATLYLAGFPITLDDLKNFRQIDSITPGHPEYGVTPGVDASTGPLGQGIAMAVGMAMAEANLRARYNNGKKEVIDHYTYVLAGDGDLMEGVSYEACSLAGTLKLNKLIILYDSNDVCLDGKTSMTFNDNVSMRFISLGWNVITVSDGESYEAISKAIESPNITTHELTDYAIAEAKKDSGIVVNINANNYYQFDGTITTNGSPIVVLKEKAKFETVLYSIANKIFYHHNQCREYFFAGM